MCVWIYPTDIVTDQRLRVVHDICILTCCNGLFANDSYIGDVSPLSARITFHWAVQWGWFARVNVLCNLSRKKSREVAASLPGRFLSRRYFTLCITVEVEPRIVKQYKCQYCCSCKNYRGKGMEGGGKIFLASFFGWPEDREFEGEKMRFGASYSTSNKLLLVARHIPTTGLQKCLSSWQCKIRKFTVTAFHCEESMHQK